MEIIVGKTAGFCFGVSQAVNRTIDLLNTKNDVFCLGELVHNKQAMQELEKQGLNIIDDIKQVKQNVIIRAHGEPDETYKMARAMGITIFDFTCPKVLKIHDIAQMYANRGYYILVIGQKKHPEIVGTISYCGVNSNIIEKSEEVEEKLNKFYSSNIKKLLVLSQTTYNIEEFNKIVDLIRNNIKVKGIDVKLDIKNTICNATRLRQEETKTIAAKVDMMIIIGGKNSSNTNKLYQIASKNCKNSVLIETVNELDLDIYNLKGINKIGIMAGASTPQKSIRIVVEMLRQIC